jgi:hypothetical protein
VNANFEGNYDEFETQLNMYHEVQTIEAKLKRKITGRRIIIQQIKNLKR